MSETKAVQHTPGPWRRGQSGNLRIYGPDGQGRDSGLLAEVFPKNGQQTANARLIAAAPELLAYALAEEELEHHLIDCNTCLAREEGDWCEVYCERANELNVRQMREAAIRKAKGEL